MKLRPEEITQISLVRWFGLQYPKQSEHLIMIGNEGKKSVVGHVIAKKMGRKKGASDLFLAWPTEKYPGLWLEVKSDKWKPSQSTKEHREYQYNFLERMAGVGYAVELGVGFDVCSGILKRYLSTDG